MGLLDLFWPAPYCDPVLGELRRHGSRWHGRIAPGNGALVPLFVAGGFSSPNAGRLQLARDLGVRYAAIRPAIERALFAHYEPYAEALAAGEISDAEAPGAPRLSHPHEVWDHVTLVRVSVERLGRADTLELAYRTAWDEEHTLGARFQGWALVELNGSVL